jgi:hypothetical protein
VDFNAIILFGLLFFLSFIGCAFFLQRFPWRQRKRRGKRRLGAAMGNAFLELQRFVQPQVEHILEEKMDEEADEDDAGGPEDPAAHLHRQLAKVRKGEKLEKLTILLPNKPEINGKLE